MRNRVFNVYKVAVLALGLIGLWYARQIYRADFHLDLVLFVILLWANNFQTISDNTGAFSVNFPLLFPVVANFGPFWAGLVAAIGIIDREEFKSHWTVVAFNRGSCMLAAMTAALAYGLTLSFSGRVLVSIASYILVNTGLYILVMHIAYPNDREYLYHGIDSLKTLIPSGALAVMFYFLYQYFTVWGVIAAYIVFLAVRSNVMFGHLQYKYRLALIRALLRATQSKDSTLMAHLENVAYLSKRLAPECGYSRLKLHVFDEACYYHDIGKLEIADSILKKPGSLTDSEFDVIKSHPEKGVEFIESIPLEEKHRQMIKNIVLYHHERYDGKGYPTGLAGEDIPLEARIVAVADTWDAMTSERCYRKPLSVEEAVEELKRARGTQLDPKVVDAFLNILDDILKESPATSQRYTAANSGAVASAS